MENDNKEVSFNSSIGKNSNKKGIKGKIIAALVIIAVIAAGAIGYCIYRKANVKELTVGLSDIELTDELKDNMRDIAVQCQAELDTNRTEKVYTSQYGLLYSYKDKVNAAVSDIVTQGSADKKALDEMDVLYIRKNAIIPESSDTGLSIFVSLNSSSGYYVISPEGENVTYTETEFKNLLMKYAPAHGEITNPKRGSEIHNAIINAAGITGDDIDIKHIACDEKYAVVVANSVKNPADIKEIALTKDESGWKVVTDSLASAKSSYIDINTLCPDMDLGLMPVYNIEDFGSIDTKDMPKIADSLIDLNMMTEADKSTMYACGCGRFVYIQLQSGKRLIGFINDDKKLEFNEAEDINSTIAYMLQCDENPPVFIAKFE